MPKQSTAIDRVFHALSDQTRLAVVERLSRGPAAVGELSQPFKMALPSFTQHLGVLEKSGLVRSQKSGRVRTYYLVPERLKTVETWLSKQRAFWEQRLNQLDNYLLELKGK